MSIPNLPGGLDPDPDRQAKFDALNQRIAQLEQLLVVATGVPAHTPVGPQLYLRQAGTADNTLYCWEPTPAAWNPLS